MNKKFFFFIIYVSYFLALFTKYIGNVVMNNERTLTKTKVNKAKFWKDMSEV